MKASTTSTLRIAIQPDSTIDYNGTLQSYSNRWIELAKEMRIETRLVDVFRTDWAEQLAGIHGFMWRCGPTPHERQLAKRLVPSLEQGTGILVYPNFHTLWHLEDKVAQHYLLDAAGIPTPKTVTFWDRESALAYCAKANYPMVFKLSYGFRATNVLLLRNAAQAGYYIEQMFGPGMIDLGYSPASSLRSVLRRLRMSAELLRGHHPRAPTADAELHHGYFYLQEFLPGNAFDTRVVVIGKRAYAFRRRNRPGDFRASGSGDNDFEDQDANLPFVRLAFRVAETLDLDTVSIDGLRRGEELVVGEIGSAYPLKTISSVPGHWVLDGAAADGSIQWKPGATRPEEAWFEDFLAKLQSSRLSA